MTVLDDGLLLVLVQKTTCLLWEFNWGLVGLEIEDVGLRDWVVYTVQTAIFLLSLNPQGNFSQERKGGISFFFFFIDGIRICEEET